MEVSSHISRTSVLPLELERHVFEICARSRPVVIPKLMLVAWRVKHWVEPLLYRTIAVPYTVAIEGYPFFTWEVLLSLIRSKPAPFFRDSVRNLSVVVNDRMKADVELLLSVCTGVENLSIMPGSAVPKADYDEAMALFLSPLRLTQLNGNLGPTLTALPPTHPLFADMTHLGLRNWQLSVLVDIEETCSHISLMPRLTHLSFADDRFIPHCPYILETCRLLRVLISLRFDSELPLYPNELEDLSHDLRFVVMQNCWHLPDWQMGIHAGVDYWTRAVDFIAKRRCKDITPLEYRIPGDASEYIAARYASSIG